MTALTFSKLRDYVTLMASASMIVGGVPAVVSMAVTMSGMLDRMDRKDARDIELHKATMTRIVAIENRQLRHLERHGGDGK